MGHGIRHSRARTSMECLRDRWRNSPAGIAQHSTHPSARKVSIYAGLDAREAARDRSSHRGSSSSFRIDSSQKSAEKWALSRVPVVPAGYNDIGVVHFPRSGRPPSLQEDAVLQELQRMIKRLDG